MPQSLVIGHSICSSFKVQEMVLAPFRNLRQVNLILLKMNSLSTEKSRWSENRMCMKENIEAVSLASE